MAEKGNSGKPSVISAEEKKIIEQKLKDPKNGLMAILNCSNGFRKEFKKEVRYNTILKYAMRNFGSSVKVARKTTLRKMKWLLTL